MRRLYFTVDVDRDANVRIPGRRAAGSLDRGSGDAPRFTSTEIGLGDTLDVLDDLGIRATLFFEGRTAGMVDCARAAGHRIGVHGYDHEDLAALGDGDLEDTVRRAAEAVTDAVGRPTCSRAPYMSADARVVRAHRDAARISYDSSLYTEVCGDASPYQFEGVTELPVPRARDASGRVIVAYLWPMHEGVRVPSDYVSMASAYDTFVLADHSWHMAETRDGGVLSDEGRRRSRDGLREVLSGILDAGFRPAVMGRRRRPAPHPTARSLPSVAQFNNVILITADISGGKMSARLILGKEVSEEIYSELRDRIAKLKAAGVTPGLAVILVGEDPASQTYVRKKGEMCEELGMRSEIIRMPEDTTQEELLARIAELNADPAIHGFLVQLPLPMQIDERAVIEAISPSKDVDCFHPSNVGRLLTGDDPLFIPATPAGVQQMLVRSGIETAGKHVVIVGRSNIVGKPMAALLMQRGADATVTVCHSKTRDLPSITRQADILIVAMGRPGFVTGDMVKDGAVVIDVGTNRVEDPTHPKGSRLVGDVDRGSVEPKASALTPVPGGVGPMTICMLMMNTVRAAEWASGASR